MTLFPLPDPEPALPERMRQMRLYYGITEGKICKNCAHLERYHQGGRWLKCALAYKTQGTGTDWRAQWGACGKWEEAK